MSDSPNTHLLAVDAQAIHHLDTGDLTNLYMWKDRSRSPDSIDRGQRLNNFVRRLWYKQNRLINNEETTAPVTQTPRKSSSSETEMTDLPHQSGSVDSLVGEEAVGSIPSSANLETARPYVRRQESSSNAFRKLKHHTTSENAGKMMVSSINDNGTLSPPPKDASSGQQSLLVPPASEGFGSSTTNSPSSSPSTTQSPRMDSPQPLGQSRYRTVVVHGFSPQPFHAAELIQAPKPARFTLGGSPSPSEQDQSLNCSTEKPISRTIDEENAAYPHTDWIDECAIDDDDDSSDWSETSSLDETFFQHVNIEFASKSRQSLIALILRSQSTSNIARPYMTSGSSVSTSPPRPNDTPSTTKDTVGPNLKHPHKMPRSRTQPPDILSPRTTRRNMLATELTESLRAHLLWERKEKRLTPDKRKTSHNVASSESQYSREPYMKQSEDVRAIEYNQYISNIGNGYNYAGW